MDLMNSLSLRFILCPGVVALLATTGVSHAQLSSSALAEIAALEQEKASFTPVQRKLDSQLVFALKQSRGELIAQGRVPPLRIGAQADPQGMVEVDIKAVITPYLIQQVQYYGGEITGGPSSASPVRALIPLARVEEIAALPEISFIRPALHAMYNNSDPEGVVTHQDNLARSTYFVDGSNVKVGVISGGVEYLAQAQANNNLGQVTVLPGQAGSTNNGEGTAMLEIVHAMAPGAQLFFATGNPTEAQFATNILNLRFTYGCDIIVDDVTYADESPFQDGIVAQAVDAVAADGCLYFSSAANSGNLDSSFSGTWEGDFASGGTVTFPTNGLVHNFGAATYDAINGTNSEQGLTILFWSDPVGASTNDYDLFVLDSNGTHVVSSSVNWQWGAQDPIEMVLPPALGQRLVVVLASGTGRFLHIDTSRAQLAIATSGNTRGHNAATNAFTVAAVEVATAYPGPFTGGAANPVENFSSDGPRRVFYFPDGTPMTPGNYSSTGGIVYQKPDVTAADGVTTDVPGYAPFHGTSAAAPHAAAIAALLKSYNPALTAAQIRSLLTSTALDIMASGVDRDAGWGIVMPGPALMIAPAPPPTILTVSPASAAAGRPVSIYGTSFRTATNVTFAGVSASFSISSNSFIQTTVPAGATSGNLSVSTPYGTVSVPFTVLPTLPPLNDNFVNAQVVTGSVFIVSGINLGATRETGEPNHAGNGGGASVWYSWTAPSSGNFTLDTIGSDFQTLLAVYTGSSVNSLTAVASNSGGGGNGTSLLTFNATGGTIYQIAVDGFNGATGDIVLRLEPATITVYSTAFEASEGFVLSSPVSGQNSWITNSGTGGNEIVSNYFAGGGQQALLGYYSPVPAVATALYRPLNYTVDTNNRPLIQFSTTMAIADSTVLNGNYDSFWWIVSNATNHNMLGILFNNSIKFIDYVLDNGSQNAGLPLYDSVNGMQATPNSLVLSMDFGRGKWSATWNGAPLTVIEQPMTTSGAALTLGVIAAYWQFGNASFPGNNYMLFDNYAVTAGPSLVPRILVGPQNVTVKAGSDVFLNAAAAGAAPLAYQWSYNSGQINGATNNNLILRNVLSGQTGTYSVLVSDANGVASASAVVTITNPPPQARFAPPVFSGNNGLLLNLSVAIGNNYRFQTSSNLVNWSTLSAFYAGGTNALCFDPATGGFKAKFYRLVSP
jgi:hypothetical protein